MKRPYQFSLMLLALLLSATGTYAHDFEVNGIYYCINGNKATVTYKGSYYNSYPNEYSGVVTIPKTVNYNGSIYSVTAIGDNAFEDCTGLTNINIPNSVTAIGTRAFEGCTSLTKVYNPNSIITIGNDAFKGCTSLTSFTIPSSVITIRSGVFRNCTSLTNITFSNSVTSIGSDAFENTAWYNNQPDGVVYAGLVAYIYKGTMPEGTIVTINDGTIGIADNAFSYCSGLASVTIPSSITTIGNYAFKSCTNLTEATLGNSVTSLGMGAFEYCSSLTSINIPDLITVIDNNIFYGCSSLASITIPSSVTTIGFEAFRDCTGLASITIPNSVTSIGGYAFLGCSALDTLNFNAVSCADFSSTLPPFNILNISTINIGNDVQRIPAYFAYNVNNITNVTIGNSVTSIGERAFFTALDTLNFNAVSCEDFSSSANYRPFGNISNINFGNNVQQIPAYFAYGDTKLTSVSIPNSVTYIGNAAFQGCTALDTLNFNAVSCADFSYSSDSPFYNLNISIINIGNSVERIPKYFAFGLSKLTNITIGNLVTSIGKYAFSGCSSLTSVTIPNSVTSIDEYVFENCTNLTEATLGNSVTSLGMGAFEYCSSLTSINIPDLITVIDNNMFNGCSSLASITIPSSVSEIRDYAFCGCFGLTSITIPNSVTFIGSSAFSGCTSLTSFTIPNSVTTIGFEAFRDCTGLASITIPNSVTDIGGGAFSGCTSLTSFTIPNSVTTIGSCMFSGCSSLTSVTIPNSVTFIGSSAFSGCTSLTSFTIPNSVTTISSSMFYGCTSLTSVTIPNSVTYIGYYAFKGCTALDTLNFNAVSCANFSSTESDRPFYNLNISTINLGDSVKLIPDYFAYGLSNLTNVTIPNSVESIGNYAFCCCEVLDHIEIPKSVTSIGKYAFAGCTWLDNVYSYISDLLTVSVDSYVFYLPSGGYSQRTLYVPTGTLEAYQSATRWSWYFGSIVEMDYQPILVESIELNPLTAELIEGETLQLTARVLPVNASDKTVTWSTSNPAIVTVDNNGLVTAIAAGTAIITATTNDGTNLSASCMVTVEKLPQPVLATSIVLNMQTCEVNLSESLQLYAEVLPEDADNKTVTWETSNETIATVDENGLVTGCSAGTATITARTIDGSNLSASCLVTVTNVQVESITLNYSELEMYEGGTAYLTAIMQPGNAMNMAVEWTSSNPRVATVSSKGRVNALEAGTTIITATTTDGSNLSASCRVNVVNPAVYNWLFMPDTQMMLGDTILIPVKLSNEMNFMAFQTDIYLPTGFSIVTDENDQLCILPSDRLTNDHVLMAEMQDDGSVRVVCYTPACETISGNEGDLFYIKLRAPENMSGEFAINLRNSRLTNANFEEIGLPDTGAVIKVMSYIPGDANDSHSVTVTDIVVTAQYLLGRNPSPFIFEAADMNGDGEVTVTDIMLIAYLINHPTMNAPKRMPALDGGSDRMSGEDVTLMVGETRTVSIQLNNEMDYTAFQLDLTLPAGLTASNFQLTDRAGNHAFDVNTLDNGKIRALCYSPAIEPIDGHEGALLTFDVTATDDIEGNITVDGIELVTAGCQTVLMNSFTISVNSTTSVNELNGAKTVARVDYFNLAGQQIDRPGSGVTLVFTTYTDGTRSTTKVIK